MKSTWPENTVDNSTGKPTLKDGIPVFHRRPPGVKPSLTGKKPTDLEVQLPGIRKRKPFPEPSPLRHDDLAPYGDHLSGNIFAMPRLEAWFDWIVGEAVYYLEEINKALDPANPLGAGDYVTARNAFDTFVAGLANPDPAEDGVLIKWARIEPEEDAHGFITGVQIIVQWAGGTHISSSSK
ncbi:MAG: hypothetical protein HYY24_18375 [Verrucomicrobia bacterium]|nr:hypothetical protein [Verrucomicrobiota bacterium]